MRRRIRAALPLALSDSLRDQLQVHAESGMNHRDAARIPAGSAKGRGKNRTASACTARYRGRQRTGWQVVEPMRKDDAALADIAKEARVPLGMSTITSRLRTRLGTPSLICAFRDFAGCCRSWTKQILPKSGCAASCRSRSRIARGWLAAAVRSERCAPNCRSTEVQLRGDREYCSRRHWDGWRRSSRHWAKEPIRAGSPCIFCPQRKTYRCWRTPSTIPE